MGAGADGTTPRAVLLLSRIVTEVICWDNSLRPPYSDWVARGVIALRPPFTWDENYSGQSDCSGPKLTEKANQTLPPTLALYNCSWDRASLALDSKSLPYPSHCAVSRRLLVCSAYPRPSLVS